MSPLSHLFLVTLPLFLYLVYLIPSLVYPSEYMSFDLFFCWPSSTRPPSIFLLFTYRLLFCVTFFYRPLCLTFSFQISLLLTCDSFVFVSFLTPFPEQIYSSFNNNLLHLPLFSPPFSSILSSPFFLSVIFFSPSLCNVQRFGLHDL